MLLVGLLDLPLVALLVKFSFGLLVVLSVELFFELLVKPLVKLLVDLV